MLPTDNTQNTPIKVNEYEDKIKNDHLRRKSNISSYNDDPVVISNKGRRSIK